MAPAPIDFVGASGCTYRFKEVLQERPQFGRIWLATSEVLHG